MGIPGLMKEIGKGDRIALAKLAIDHFEKHKRPLRIAIDAAIWNFQTQYGGAGGKNPALRTLYFRLLRLLALPIHPVFVYDGKNKPLTKRGKTVSRYGTCVPAELSKNLVARFQFPHHVAPGEAEAECAFLQRNGIVDAVMTQDVDAMMFGSTLTLRDWSKEGTKGNKAPTHVSVFDSVKIKDRAGLDSSGMVLVALLNGGDYHEGIAGFGPGLSCEVARAGFGQELIDLVNQGDENGIREWRERLQYELESNESGYFQKRHKTVKVPSDFPNRIVMDYYLNPAVSSEDSIRTLEKRWLQWWDREIDIAALREYVKMTFDWLYRKGATYFIRSLAQPLFQSRLQMCMVDSSTFSHKDITQRRMHFTTDAVPELRLAAVPETVVGIDLAAEEEDPEFAEIYDDPDDEADLADNFAPSSTQPETEPVSPTKRKQKPAWDPSTMERWWIPEALLITGMPVVVDEWHREQEAIRADPIRFATRKCKPAAQTATKPAKQIDQSMQVGALKSFFSISKGDNGMHNVQPKSKPTELSAPTRRRQPLARSRSNPVAQVSVQHTVLEEYFKLGKFVPTPRTINEEKDSDLQSASVSAKAHDRPAQEVLQKKSSNAGGSITQMLDSCLKDLDLPELDELLKAVTPRTPRRRSFKRSKTMPIVMDSTPEQEAFAFDIELPDTITRRKTRNPLKKSPHLRSEASLGYVLESSHDAMTPDFDTKNQSDHSVIKLDFTPALQPTPARTQAEMLRSVSRKAAKSRDSLPGTWKTVDMTPSQPSKISFVDMTDL